MFLNEHGSTLSSVKVSIWEKQTLENNILPGWRPGLVSHLKCVVTMVTSSVAMVTGSVTMVTSSVAMVTGSVTMITSVQDIGRVYYHI